MKEQAVKTVSIFSDSVREVLCNTKVVMCISGYVIGVNWIDLFSEVFKYTSSAAAFIALVFVIMNRRLERQKLKLEIKKLEREEEESNATEDR